MNLEQFTKWVSICAQEYAKSKNPYRKDGVTPYFSHPARVALLYQYFNPCDIYEIGVEMYYKIQAIVFGHDLKEDCEKVNDEFLYFTLHNIIGCSVEETDYIISGISILSEDKTITPRSKRIAEYYRYMAEADNYYIWQIKLCDRIDNLVDSGLDEIFMRSTYISESRVLYNMIVEYDGHSPASNMLLEKIVMHEGRIKNA